MAADEIDYQVIGDDLQAVIITLDPGEAVFAEAGAMMFMREGITMATTLDPNSKSGGLFDKLVGADQCFCLVLAFDFGQKAPVKIVVK